jgi:hypothetical protein
MAKMQAQKTKDVTGGRRSVMQNAKLAIRDVFDAFVELITNSDDRYQRLDGQGTIEIEVERGGKGKRLLRVRDHADGMTLDAMDKKLSWTGGRFSGLEEGYDVRGTNSRGAKDIAALGAVRFESIAQEDGRYHSCEISSSFRFKRLGTDNVSASVRKRTGLASGSGMVVTVQLDSDHTLPRFDNLKDRIQRLVALRDILGDPNRKIILRDSSQKKAVVLSAPSYDATDRVKQTFEIPGYPGATAKLVIRRAGSPFEREQNRFRLGGILVKSRHTIHEATYFDPELERDQHALWFCGKLTCPHIDDLWNDFDNRFEADLPLEATNAVPILDPSRQSGLTTGHPFVTALFREALRRLRPLVEEERQRDERQRAEIESRATRKRLDALEKAAVKFMKEFGEEDEASRDADSAQQGSHFRNRGYVLSPPFAQMVQGHTRQFWLTINQEVFPELESGANVEVQCVTPDIRADRRFVNLEPHPNQEGALRAVWKVKALNPTPATDLRVKAGSITGECAIEVFATEADRYRDIGTLCFGRKRYRIYTDGKPKRLKVLAPVDLIPEQQQMEVSLSNRHFRASGNKTMRPNANVGVSIGEVTVRSDGTEAQGVITVTVGEVSATAELRAVQAPGAGLKIQLEDIDLANQRYRWRQNVLEVAARHKSLARYLGSPPKFAGQESKHFRVLLAEIVADAVCAKLLEQNIQANPEDYEEADWNTYYADYSKFMTRFLPIAHKLQCPDVA